MAQTNSSEICALCGSVGKLKQSHIIPQFVYRWQRETSGTDCLCSGETITRREQDGPVRPMLCGCCEDLFSSYESDFARRLFHPMVANPKLPVKYGNWLLKFGVSVCWRILEDRIFENRLGDFQGRWTTQLASCREAWRQYAFGKRPDVGEHHIHLLFGDGVIDGAGALPPTDPNRSLRRVVEMDVACSDDGSFVYAKLGPFIFLGMIAYTGPKQWHGTRICAEGKIKLRELLVPVQYRDYIFARARLLAAPTPDPFS